MLTTGDVVCELRQIREKAEISQVDIVNAANEKLRKFYGTHKFPKLDRVSLSKGENESIILIPSHVHAIAAFLDCTAHDIYPLIYPEEPAG